MTLLAPLILLGQLSAADLKTLRQYRYGLSAARIEAMGEGAYLRLYEAKTPDRDVGYMRGVGPAVYTDAYRENTERRYRAPLPLLVQARLLALDKQMRFVGVLFARNAWDWTGGNAYDPDSDVLDYAQAERRLYTDRAGRPDPAGLRRALASYKAKIRRHLDREEPIGLGTPAASRKAILANLGRIDRTVAKATALCRTPAERSVLFDFVAREARDEV